MRRILPPWQFLSMVVAAYLALLAAAVPAAELVRSASPDWPQWRGPCRDGVSEETGLLGAWPEGGPKLLWTADGIGRGYAAPIVVADTLYIPGDGEEDLTITALTLEGDQKWQKTNGAIWVRPYPGARASCSYDEGKLYHMNAHGRLACMEAETGAEVWAVNILERFEAKNIIWGISESVVVDGDLVFVTPVGAKGRMAALDKRTGKTVWTAQPLEGDQASYASPILMNVDGSRVLVASAARNAFAVDAETGEVLGQIAHLDPDNTITGTPVLAGDQIVLANASRNFGAAYGVGLGDREGERVWSAEVTISHGGMVGRGGKVYGASSRGDAKGWLEIDATSGEATVLDERPVGSLAYADDRFYCLTQEGTMTLQKLEQGKFVTTGSFQLAEGKDVWTHPVICHGRLFLRYHDTLYCYDIRQ